MSSSFIKNIYIFDIFYHFPQSEQSKSEVKKKNLCARGVKILSDSTCILHVLLYHFRNDFGSQFE